MKWALFLVVIASVLCLPGCSGPAGSTEPRGGLTIGLSLVPALSADPRVCECWGFYGDFEGYSVPNFWRAHARTWTVTLVNGAPSEAEFVEERIERVEGYERVAYAFRPTRPAGTVHVCTLQVHETLDPNSRVIAARSTTTAIAASAAP